MSPSNAYDMTIERGTATDTDPWFGCLTTPDGTAIEARGRLADVAARLLMGLPGVTQVRIDFLEGEDVP